MNTKKSFSLLLSEHEVRVLQELLGQVRKNIAHEYHASGKFESSEAIQNPLFIEACKLHFKVDKLLSPDLKIKLQDYYDYGNEGKSN